MTIANYEKTGIGERVARYRKWRGFRSAQELADAIPAGMVTRSTIVNIELGRKRDPSVGDLIGIAYGLAISPLALLVDIEEPFEATDMPEIMPGEWREIPNLELLRVLALEHTLDAAGDAVMRDPAYIYQALIALRRALHSFDSYSQRAFVEPEQLQAIRGPLETLLKGVEFMLPSLRGADIAARMRSVVSDRRVMWPDSNLWSAPGVTARVTHEGASRDVEHSEAP